MEWFVRHRRFTVAALGGQGASSKMFRTGLNMGADDARAAPLDLAEYLGRRSFRKSDSTTKESPATGTSQSNRRFA
jgi:hypothetical protein